MRAITCVDHWNIEVARDVIGSAGCRVAHDKAIGFHGVQVEGCVEQSFALFQAGSLGLQIHGVRAKPRSRGTEADASTRGSFKKRERDRLAAQRG